MINTPQSVGVYVHLPWCIHKCPYCDFNSHEASQEKVRSIEEEYVDTLIKEFNFYQDLIKERIITSIFLVEALLVLFHPNYLKNLLMPSAKTLTYHKLKLHSRQIQEQLTLNIFNPMLI